VTRPADPPQIGRLVEDGRLKLQRPDTRALRDWLQEATVDLEASRSNQAAFPSWAQAMLYEAGLRCARVIVHAAGYRIAVDRGHVTAIDGADALTGGRQHRLFVRLHRMRRQRHDFMYESAPDPSGSDLEQWQRDIAGLIALAESALADVE
jgi:hypothetical protein